jgi:transcriptional regulator with PAS, ATPase and Fis domain
MNHLTAGETVIRVLAYAAQGEADTDVLISERDVQELHDVARWLIAGAIARGQTVRKHDRLPQMTMGQLQHAAIKQALEDNGGHKGRTCAQLDINPSTLYRISNGIRQGRWNRPKGAKSPAGQPDSSPVPLVADEC